MAKRKTFSREFKLEAIRLLESGDKKSSDLARELGVPRNRLYKWRDQLQAADDAPFAERFAALQPKLEERFAEVAKLAVWIQQNLKYLLIQP